jgi:phage shock protein A
MAKTTELLGAEGALSVLLARMADGLVETKNLVAAAKKEEARLAKQAEVAARAAEQWGQRAMAAVRAGDDVVAKDALVRQRDGERRAGEFQSAQGRQRREVERLTGALSEQSLRLEEGKQRKNAVLARARRAGAEPSLDAVARPREGSVLDLLDRLEAVVAAAEREGAVARELSDEALAANAEGAGTQSRIESDLLYLKGLAKAPALTEAKPLAKTKGDAPEAEAPRASAGASREPRTKR